MSSGITQPNKNAALVLDQKAMAGVDKYFTSVAKVTIAGNDYTPAQLKAVLQAEVDAVHALDAARGSVNQQVTDTRKASAQARTMRKELRDYILGTYGSSAVQMLEDFGMSVPKPGKRTARAKADAADAAKATREARHTLGKKQKKGIKGTVPAKTPSKPTP
jgi:hypothetical protein